MTFKVLKEFETETIQGALTLKEGQVIKLSKEEAIPLIEEGKIKPYCYWLKNTVNDCHMPCFEIDAMTVIRECSHFKIFWAKRCKEIERKCNVNR